MNVCLAVKKSKEKKSLGNAKGKKQKVANNAKGKKRMLLGKYR